MAADARIATVCGAIEHQVAQLLESRTYKAWAEPLSLQDGDLVMFNNSFLYREGITGTVKSERYLAVQLDGEGHARLPPVITHGRINAQFKRIPVRQADESETKALDASVAEELDQLGRIVFALVGEIGDDKPVSVGLPVTGFDLLRYEPKQSELVKLDGASIAINNLEDVDVLWRALEAEAGAAAVDIAPLTETFEDAVARLSEEAGRPVDIDNVRTDGSSILGDVIGRLNEQIAAYQRSLERHLAKPDDKENLSELLRIAYNFADGAKALITLVVGISDLKPIIFWLTISSQFELADRFADLPFALVGKAKPSLDRYRTVISGARNRAFHDLFSFTRPFQVQLTGDAFRSAELRLFRDYTRRSHPALQFEDRPLIELLERFTRAPERQVPLGFWEGNLEVMRAVESLATAVQEALVLAAEAGLGKPARA